MKFSWKNFILLWIVLPGFPLANASDIRVGPQQTFTTIKAALAAAQDGDRILIEPGTYREGNILVSKAVHIKGVDFPVLDGENNSEILTISVSGVTIEGLQLQNVGTSYTEDRAGIKAKNARNIKVINNRLLNTFFGIYLGYVNDAEVRNNEVIGQAVDEMSSGNAIHLWYCKRLIIEGNQVRQHRDGIYLEFADHCKISNNTSENNLRYGLHFMFSNDNEYSANQFRRNGAGVAVMFSKNIKMFENTFSYNWGSAAYGLLLKEIYDAEIWNNHFLENTIGIYVEGSTRIKYFQNNFTSNGWAMKMSGGCLDNTLTKNNFIGNTFDLSINSAVNNNSFDGNYWGEYSGYDLNRDGVGDVPYRPVKLFNFIVNQTPEASVLLRSLFVDIINFSEKINPSFTPKKVLDNQPQMKKMIFSSAEN